MCHVNCYGYYFFNSKEGAKEGGKEVKEEERQRHRRDTGEIER
jgi:hypothetical protein